jgi:dihydrofolate reductase
LLGIVYGFIARPDGGLDWLPPIVPQLEDYGHQAFSSSIDTLVMGRATYEKVLTFGTWPYQGKRTVVLSSGRVRIPDDLKPLVASSSLAPYALAQYLEATGSKSVQVDGGKTIQSFLRVGLIDEIVITMVPVLIGRGLPLFGPLDGDVRPELMSCRSFADGLVQCAYRVQK